MNFGKNRRKWCMNVEIDKNFQQLEYNLSGVFTYAMSIITTVGQNVFENLIARNSI